MTKGVIYSRVSTEEQAKEGQSIESQLRICQQYAKDNGIDIVNAFVDEGKSATNMNRPALKDMLAAVEDKNQHIEVILVQDTDRLARNTSDHLQIKAILRKHSARLIAISQPGIDDSPEGNFLDTLLAATNAFQSQITGRKTSKVMEQKALYGWFPGGTPPLGYRNSDNPSPVSSMDRRIIVIDPSMVATVREIFQMYATGNYNTNEMADWLNEKGIRTARGSKVHTSLVVRTLNNPFYIGKFRWKGKEYQGKHEPIIELGLFNQVQTVMAVHNQGASRKRIHNFLLRGFLICGTCGGRLWGEQHARSNKLYSFYYCKKCGRGSYADLEKLEKAVAKKVAGIQISEGYREQVLQLASKIIEESRDTRSSEKNRLDKEQASLEKALREAEDDRYVRHVITSEAFNNLSERYRDSLAKVKQQLEGLDIDHTEKLKTLDRILMLAENIGEAYRLAEPAMKREYLGLFFAKFIISEGKIASYELAEGIKELIEDGSVRVSTNGLPR